MNRFRLLSVLDDWLNIYLLVNTNDEVGYLSFQPIEGNFSEIKSHPYTDAVKRYLAGDPKALDEIKVVVQGSDFSQKVLQTMRQVQFGETISYSELARRADFPGAARAVGTVCKNNPIPLIIPCHRIIKANGQLGHYAYGQTLKQQLLEHEQNKTR